VVFKLSVSLEGWASLLHMMASIILHVQSNILFHFAQQESDDVQTVYRKHVVDTRPILLVPFEGGSSTREMGKNFGQLPHFIFPTLVHWDVHILTSPNLS
jgi:hypothetical protein